MSQRMIAGAATLGLCLATAACGGGSTSSSGSGGKQAQSLTALSTWTSSGGEGPVLKQVVADLQKRTGIKVRIIEQGETLPDTYDTSFAAGKEADVVIVNLAEKTNDWVKNGEAIAASNYLDAWDLTSKIEPQALDEWKGADGKVQGFPYSGFVWPVWYNMALLKKAGITQVPATTDQLITDAGKLKAAGIQPLVIGGTDWSGQKLFEQIIQSYMTPDEAKKVFSKGGYCASPSAMKGIQLFTKLRDAGVFAKDSQGLTADQMNSQFYAGKAAIMSAGSWAFANTPAKIAPNVKLGGLPLPPGGQYDKPTAYRGYTGAGFWISPNGKKKIDAVKQFITAFYDPSVVAEFAAKANVVTAGKTSGTVKAQNPLMATAVTTWPQTVGFAVMPDIYVPGPVADPMIRQTALAYGSGDASKICQTLDKVYS